jgi:hypothetical protein
VRRAMDLAVGHYAKAGARISEELVDQGVRRAREPTPLLAPDHSRVRTAAEHDIVTMVESWHMSSAPSTPEVRSPMPPSPGDRAPPSPLPLTPSPGPATPVTPASPINASAKEVVGQGIRRGVGEPQRARVFAC